jgi:hypothetical protein
LNLSVRTVRTVVSPDERRGRAMQARLQRMNPKAMEIIDAKVSIKQQKRLRSKRGMGDRIQELLRAKGWG